MKKNKYIAFILFWAAISLVSCIKKEDPPQNFIPTGTVMTLEEVMHYSNGYVFDSAASVFATVTMDESNGNLNKLIYVQDSTAGISLTFADDDSHLRQGDDIRIYLKGLTLSDNNGMFTLKTVNYTSNIVLLDSHRVIEPKEVTISDIETGNYNGQLVRLMGVEFQDTTQKWADAMGLSTQNRTLKSCDGKTIIARTSGYATFADEMLPSGYGSLVAIAGVYKTSYSPTYQLYVRSLEEVKMDEDGCEGRTLLQESFATSQGKFTIENVKLPAGGSYVWSHDASYFCMKASAYIGGTDYESESWLISPAMDFSEVNTATLTFDHAINYLDDFANIADFCTVLISTNYTSGNPNSADWQAVEVNYPNKNSWTFVPSDMVDLDLAAQQPNVHLAFRYKSKNGDAPTWEVNNVLISKID